MATQAEHVFSSSQLDSYAMCPRKFYYTYMMNVVPNGINWNLAGGTLIHKALEVFYVTKSVSDGVEAAKVAAQELSTGQFFSVEDEYKRDLYLSIIAGALPAQERYWKDFVDYNVLSVEAEFDNVRIEGYLFKGVIDLIMANNNGSVVIMDHKSAARVTGDTLAVLPMQYQTAIYPTVASAISGRQVKRMIYNYIIKPNIYQRKTETSIDYLRRVVQVIPQDPAKYLMRQEVKVGTKRTEKQLRNIRETCKVMSKNITKFPKTPKKWTQCPKACSMFGHSCEYLPFCLSSTKNAGALALYQERKKT